MPGPGESDPEGDASPGDLAAGLVRTMWPWLVGVGAVVVVAAFLLWGANRPDDPKVVGADGEGGTGSRTASTPADGLEFAEIGRMIGDSCLKLLVADDSEERFSGLRGRESELERVDGMLFVGDGPSAGGFTMSGVVEPIQLGFYDADGRRVGGHLMEPCAGNLSDCPTYPPPEGETWSFAVETAPGRLPEGDLGGECSPDDG